MERLVGTRVLRVEDQRILTGRGRYIDDVQLDGMVHAAFVRSPYPHARITRIDTAAAKQLPGVVGVFTAEDLAPVVYPMAVGYPPEGFRHAMWTCLATDKVRLVGDTVALVVATSRAVAEDGVDLVEVDYDDLPGVGSIGAALAEGAPKVWDQLEDNVALDTTDVYGDPDAAFAKAHKVIKERFVEHRVTNCPMETRGIIAHYQPGDGTLDIRICAQGTGSLKLGFGAMLQIPSNKVNVACGDIGGSFGQKGMLRHEEVAVAAASKALGRPVKWIEDRSENLTVGGQARDEVVEAEIAVDAEGRILGARFDVALDAGAYPIMGLPATLFTTQARVLIPGAYRLVDYSFRARVTYSNKATYVAYRGPWEVETWVRERLLDRIGREMGIDPVDVRRRNLRLESEYPVALPAGPTLAGITLRSGLDKSEKVAGWSDFRAKQAAQRATGSKIQLGMGVVSFIEPAPGPPDYGPAIGFAFPPERAKAVLEADGTLTVYTTQLPHGQSHETTLSMIAADELGVPMSSVKLIWGDSRTTPFTVMGTGGSRAATVASGAVAGVTRAIKTQVAEIMAHMMEASPDDVEIVDGMARIIGTPEKAMPLAQLATVAWMVPQMLPPGRALGLEATFDFHSGDGGWSQSVHTCCVAVDTETGEVSIERYVVVEDCGDVINPGVVEGQIRGGIAQGVAQVLYEHSDYDVDGNFRSSTFMDYLLPTSMEVPVIEIHHVDQTVATQEVNYRGVGEGGCIGAPAALCSAIEDALSPYNVKITEQHLPPYKVLELIGAIEREG